MQIQEKTLTLPSVLCLCLPTTTTTPLLPPFLPSNAYSKITKLCAHSKPRQCTDFSPICPVTTRVFRFNTLFEMGYYYYYCSARWRITIPSHVCLETRKCVGSPVFHQPVFALVYLRLKQSGLELLLLQLYGSHYPNVCGCPRLGRGNPAPQPVIIIF